MADARAPAAELPRVRVDDIEGARECLREHGVCVFTDAATPDEVEHAKELFWAHLERSTGLGIKRDDIKTMDSHAWWELGFMGSGVVTEHSVGHSEFLWYCRQLPGVQRLFRTLWHDEIDEADPKALVTSFDGCGVARNPFVIKEGAGAGAGAGAGSGSASAAAGAAVAATGGAGGGAGADGDDAAMDAAATAEVAGGAAGAGRCAVRDADAVEVGAEDKAAEDGGDGDGAAAGPGYSVRDEWLTSGGWYHLDQNGSNTPGFELYQGVLNLLPTNAHTGSTVVCPGSHHKFAKIFAPPKNKGPHAKGRAAGRGDFVMLSKPGDYERWCTGAVQVNLRPGEFLVWDSRIVHCNQGVDPTAAPWDVLPDGREREPIARLVAYICMMPRSKIPADALAKRVEFARKGVTTGHHPGLRGRRGADAEARRQKPPAHGFKAPKKHDKRWDLV